MALDWLPTYPDAHNARRTRPQLSQATALVRRPEPTGFSTLSWRPSHPDFARARTTRREREAPHAVYVPQNFPPEVTRLVGVVVLGSRCLRLTFSPGLRVNGKLYDPSNYAFSVRLGYAKMAYTKTVTAPEGTVDGGVVSSLTICVRDHFSLRGRYRLSVRGVVDEFGREVEAVSNIDT